VCAICGVGGWADGAPQVSSNLIEPGENALVLHTGYFGDSFAEWCVVNAFVFIDRALLFTLFRAALNSLVTLTCPPLPRT
jgi:hypothetical protein